jgi:hypothetical protein
MTEKLEPTGGTGVVRAAALVLIVVPFLEVFAMAHHPSVHAHELTQVVAELRAAAGSSALVHGILIALMYLVLLALTEFSVQSGLSRAAVRAALIAYGAGVVFMTAAALVSGFITGRIALAVPALAPADPALIVQFATLATLFNQAFARCAAVLMSAGIAAWSLALLRGSVAARAVGGFGLLTGIGCALAVISGVLRLDVHGMAAVLALQSLWTVGVGCLLWRATRAGYGPAQQAAA